MFSFFRFGNSHDLMTYSGCASLLKIMWILSHIAKTQINRMSRGGKEGTPIAVYIIFIFMSPVYLASSTGKHNGWGR